MSHGDTEAKQEGNGSSMSHHVCVHSFKWEVNTRVVNRCRGGPGIVCDAFLGFPEPYLRSAAISFQPSLSAHARKCDVLWLAAHWQMQLSLTTCDEMLFRWTIKPLTFCARWGLLKTAAVKLQPSKCSSCLYKCCLMNWDSLSCAVTINSVFVPKSHSKWVKAKSWKKKRDPC